MPRLIVGLIFGAITLSLLLVGLVYVLAIISYPKIALSITGLYLTLNIMLFTLPLTALAMVIGLVISKAEIVSIISTVFALAQAFFSGAFLPTFLLPKSIINVGKVFPASHTVTINNLLAEGLNTNGPSILLNIGILLAYFAVFLTIAIILSKKITKREG
jgi:ABC-2 type transport system permease protein